MHCQWDTGDWWKQFFKYNENILLKWYSGSLFISLVDEVNLLSKTWLYADNQYLGHFWPFNQYEVILKTDLLLILKKKNYLYFM